MLEGYTQFFRGRLHAPIPPTSPTMALTRTLKAFDLTTVQQTLSESYERESLTALSQRKLNALAMPLAYIDRHQR